MTISDVGVIVKTGRASLVIAKLLSTVGAGLYVRLPDCDARMVHCPTARVRTTGELLFNFTAQIEVVREEKVTAKWLEAVAMSFWSVALGKVIADGCENVITCDVAADAGALEEIAPMLTPSAIEATINPKFLRNLIYLSVDTTSRKMRN